MPNEKKKINEINIEMIKEEFLDKVMFNDLN